MGKSCYNNYERQCNVAYNLEDGLYGYYLSHNSLCGVQNNL
jgi:hypothetical protein